MDIVRFEGSPGYEFVVCDELSREGEEEIHDIFSKLASGHQGGSAKLRLLPYDTDKFPEQRMDVVGMSGEEADVDTVRALASAAYSGFPEVERAFARRPETLNNIALEIDGGNKVVANFDHEQIINSPVGGAALNVALREFAAKETHLDLSRMRTSLIASKLITRLAAFGDIPTSRVLTNIYDLRYSIPPSRNVRKSGIPEMVRKTFNPAMLSAYREKEEQMNEDDRPGELLVISGSGATDVKRRGLNLKHTVHMGPMANGTGQIMTEASILPVTFVMSRKKPIIKVGYLQNPIEHASEGHGVMAKLAEMNTAATGIQYIYHPTREGFDGAVG